MNYTIAVFERHLAAYWPIREPRGDFSKRALHLFGFHKIPLGLLFCRLINKTPSKHSMSPGEASRSNTCHDNPAGIRRTEPGQLTAITQEM